MAAAVLPQGQIELFIVAKDGTVLHRALSAGESRQADGHGRSLGGPVRGSLTPLYTPGAGLSLFALGCDGSVMHKRRKGRDWPTGGDWDSLGGRFQGWLGATHQDDGTLLLVLFSEDRTVYVNAWVGYPETPPPKDWEDAGSIDSLFEQQIVRVESGVESASLRAASG